MHWNDADGAARDLRLNVTRVDRERHRVGIGEYDSPPGLCDSLGRRDPGVRRGDHLVARREFEGAHRNVERVGAVCARHATTHTDRVREPLLELGDEASADEG